MKRTPSVLIIGSGIIGIATAYYLTRHHRMTNLTLVDRDQPMGFTSAQSGENYRNWWPHPTMVDFTNHSIDLMEQIARDSGNRINMTRRGYALATRASNIEALIAQLHEGLQKHADRLLRFHEGNSASTYEGFQRDDWQTAPDGVDILQDQTLIRSHFPTYDPDIRTVIHIRRGGDIGGQQLGAYMLEYLREAGCTRVTGRVESITQNAGFTCHIEGHATPLQSDLLVNAAGPFAGDIAKMLGVDLPVFNTFQQKIAFEDTRGTIPRTQPFSIDLDPQHIDWTDEDRDLLAQDPTHRWLTEEMPGAIHCRPDGGDNGRWVKLGWAYNTAKATPTWEQPLDPAFPDIVLRRAARLNPALKAYYGKLPQKRQHYGGWYTLTEENWPLIGPMGPEGSFMSAPCRALAPWPPVRRARSVRIGSQAAPCLLMRRTCHWRASQTRP